MFSPSDKPAIVYCATNKKNGKRYIGVTTQKFGRRQWQHAYTASRHTERGAFAHAIRKYGADGFTWDVLSEFSDSRSALDEEKRLIRETKPEYNATPGGQMYVPRVLSDQAKRNIANASKGNTYRLGKGHTAEVKDRLRQLGIRDRDKWLDRSKMGPAALAKRVVCIDDGKVYESASAAARAYGAQKSAVIEVCLQRPFRKTAAGRVFRYWDGRVGEVNGLEQTTEVR